MLNVRAVWAIALALFLSACGSSVSESDLVGIWSKPEKLDGNDLVVFMDLRADKTLTISVRSAYKEASENEQGKWFLEGKQLHTKVDSGPEVGSDEVVALDTSSLVLRDLDKAERPLSEWTRHTGPIPAQIASSAPAAKAAPAPKAANAAPAPVPSPAPAPAAPAPVIKQLLDDYALVQTKGLKQYTLTVGNLTKIQVVVDIEDNTPLDVMVLPAELGGETYEKMKWAVVGNESDKTIDMLGKMFGDKETANKFKTGSKFTEREFYDFPLTRKGAHRHYENTAELPAGKYVIILDNSGDISPTLGDASVHLQLFASNR